MCVFVVYLRVFQLFLDVCIPKLVSFSFQVNKVLQVDKKQGLTHHKFLEKSPTNTRAKNTTIELTFLKRTVSRV